MYQKSSEINTNLLKFIFLNSPKVSGLRRKHIKQWLRYVQSTNRTWQLRGRSVVAHHSQ